MMSKALIPILLAGLLYVSAQTTTPSTTTSTASTTTSASSPTTTPSSSTTTSTGSTTTTASNSTSTSTESSSTASTPTINTCQSPGRYPATSAKCNKEYIVCIPNFQGGFWEHKWKCLGSLVYNDKFKKCTNPRKADCPATAS